MNKNTNCTAVSKLSNTPSEKKTQHQTKKKTKNLHLQTSRGSWFGNKRRKKKGGEKRKICWLVGERERDRKKKRGWLLSRGHFGCHLSPWRRGPGPQKPLGRTDCLRGARYFLQHHLSLSPHNDSPRSSLLMFVIALSHKGGWSMEPRGASRGQEMPDCCLSI